MSTESTNTSTSATEPTTMDELVAIADLPPIPAAGDLVEGRILSIQNKEIRVDIDGLTTGVIRGPELFDASGDTSDLKVGDTITATVVDIENERGEMELSLLQAGHQRAWEKLSTLQTSGEKIEVKVVGANKGGLLVKLGKINGFLPVSQLTPEHYPRVEGGDKNKILESLQKFVNKMLEVKIIDAIEKEEKLIVSEKALWEEQQRETLSQYTIGNVVEGTVTGLVDFGAFIELPNGLEGLIHISEIAWQRLDHPRDVLTVGQTVKAQIISIEGSRISLSIKRLTDDPWAHVAERYAIGQMVEGTVLKVNPFGLFVELDSAIHGLAHVSELSRKTVADPRAVAKPGDKLQFQVISIEPKEHRLGLSLKTSEDPAIAIPTTPAAPTETVPTESTTAEKE